MISRNACQAEWEVQNAREEYLLRLLAYKVKTDVSNKKKDEVEEFLKEKKKRAGHLSW